MTNEHRVRINLRLKGDLSAMAVSVNLSVVVENRTGASGMIAAADVAKSRPTATRS
jgi:tripartite-type tricarboxylate transporter receptor subunit TctC